MTGLELVVVVVLGVWMTILSLVCLLVVRQIALVTARLDMQPTHLMESFGPELGTEISPDASEAIPRLSQEVSTFVVLLSATCIPCREVAADLRSHVFSGPVVALIAGEGEVAEAIVEMTPGEFEIVRDPMASNVATELGLDSAPFALHVSQGKVRGKAYLHKAGDLVRLIDGAQEAAGTAVREREGDQSYAASR